MGIKRAEIPVAALYLAVLIVVGIAVFLASARSHFDDLTVGNRRLLCVDLQAHQIQDPDCVTVTTVGR